MLTLSPSSRDFNREDAMTDRELLELAAKAADIGYEPDNPNVWPWNPLEDNGAALQLAVALKIHVSPMIATWWEQDGTEHKFENDGSEPLADTRRAIVRAAAAIGGKA